MPAPPDRPVEPPPPGALALARLVASRARLAQRLLPPVREDRGRRWAGASAGAMADGAGLGSGAAGARDGAHADGQAQGSWASTLENLWQGWRERLSDTPIAPLLDTGRVLLAGWWQRQPWRSNVEAVGSELRATAVPLVQRHPWAAVLLSAGLAAGLVWFRPWRAGWLRPHVQPLPRHAGRWLLRQASLLPLQAVVPALLAIWRLSQAASPTTPPQPAAGTPAAQPAPPGRGAEPVSPSAQGQAASTAAAHPAAPAGAPPPAPRPAPRPAAA